VALLYRVAGRGTALLADRRVGDTVQVFGPLGNGFTGPEGPGRRVLLAGGMGVAPLLGLAEEGRSSGWFRPEDTEVLYGGATASELVCEAGFRALGLTVRTATDDGTAGFHGTAVDLLMERGKEDGFPAWVFAVGPVPMYAALEKLPLPDSCRISISLERRMACGLGACRSCVVSVRNGNAVRYTDVCKTGPVFDLNEIVLDGLD